MAIMIINIVFINACPVELFVKLNTLHVGCANAIDPKCKISIVIHAKNPIVNVIETISQNIL
jgi:hypothetical protein